jgi:O-antigen ligase
MPAVAADLETSRTMRGSRLFPAVFLLAPIVTAAAPRLTSLFLLLVAACLIVAALRRGFDWRRLLQPNAALAALLLFSLYTFVNSTWALDQGEAFGKSATLLGAILLAFAGTAAADVLDGPQVRRAALAFVIGTAIAAIFLLIELLTHGAITRAAMNLIPLLQPDNVKHARIANGEVTRLSSSEFNPSITLMMLNLWPGLLILSTWSKLPGRTVLVAAFFLVLAAPIAVSDHDSSQVALVVSAIVLLLGWRWRPAAIKSLAVLWCLMFALVIPADLFAYKAELHFAEWLPKSARARIIIWQYTADRALERPLLGIGVNSTSTLRDQEKQIRKAEKPEGFVFGRGTGQHAHDIFLQTWFELGVIGVILLALAGAAVVLRIAVLPLVAQPFGLATFTAFATIAAFAWGMWQTWFICAIGLAPLYLRLAAAAAESGRKPAKGKMDKFR